MSSKDASPQISGLAGEPASQPGDLPARLQSHGIRVTAQRLRIAGLLLAAPQHRSAEQIAVDDTRSWFDSNVEPHYHFHDETSGALTDVALPEVQFSRLPAPPKGMEVAGLDLVIRLRPAQRG
jgi:Fur family iron response transcriptional regulator